MLNERQKGSVVILRCSTGLPIGSTGGMPFWTLLLSSILFSADKTVQTSGRLNNQQTDTKIEYNLNGDVNKLDEFTSMAETPQSTDSHNSSMVSLIEDENVLENFNKRPSSGENIPPIDLNELDMPEQGMESRLSVMNEGKPFQALLLFNCS